jgi:hypothetical protein
MTNPYCLPGIEPAVMRGRSATFTQLCRDLIKPTPDNVSIVGPRYFGKTVIMRALSEHFSSSDSYYQIVCYWDLRHNTPLDDIEFKRKLAQQIDKKLLAINRSDFHEYLNPPIIEGPDLGDMIDLAVGSLEAEGIRVLILLDDFDRLASQIQITKNLWDYLRSLAERSNFRFVTTSRQRLRDLIPSRESRTSDFWNYFANVITLRPIDGKEFAEFVKPLADLSYAFDDSARKEFFNWTGGVPVLAAAMCGEIVRTVSSHALTKTDIDQVGEALVDVARDILADLWDDCSQETQGDLIDLHASREHGNNISPRRRDVLLGRGYLIQDSGGFRGNCRLILKFASLNETVARDLRDLFRESVADERNFKKILEIKLSQVQGGDAEIRSFINLAIHGLSNETRASMTMIRSIAEHAMQLAWDAEFPTGTIPGEVQTELTKDRGPNTRLDPNLFSRTYELGVRRRILRQAVGGDVQRQPKLTRKVTRPIMILIDHLHSLGNFGQHMKDIPPERERPVDFTFCVSACFVAIVLLKRMAEDLA